MYIYIQSKLWPARLHAKPPLDLEGHLCMLMRCAIGGCKPFGEISKNLGAIAGNTHPANTPRMACGCASGLKAVANGMDDSDSSLLCSR